MGPEKPRALPRGFRLERLQFHQLHAARQGCPEYPLGRFRGGQRLPARLGLEAMLAHQRAQPGDLLTFASLGQQRQRQDVVHAGNHGDPQAAGEGLGGILRAGPPGHRRRGAHEPQPRLLHSADEIVILGHEPVAGEEVGVPAAPCNLQDSGDSLRAPIPVARRVIGNAMDALVPSYPPQLRRQRPAIDHAVFFRQQNSAGLGAQPVESGEGLQPDWPPAHDQHLDVIEPELLQPPAGRLLRAGPLGFDGLHGIPLRWGRKPASGAGPGNMPRAWEG